MRVVISNCTCEWCETPFDMPDEDTPLDEALDSAGWFLVSHNGEEQDFCSNDCLVSFYS